MGRRELSPTGVRMARGRFVCHSLFQFLPSDTITGWDYRITTRRLITHTPACVDFAFPEATPEVSSALERKSDEPFATLRLITHTPAVWILNFRVRDTKSGRAFRHTASRNATPAVWDPILTYNVKHKNATSLEIAFRLFTWR